MIPFVKMHGCGNDFVVVRWRDFEPFVRAAPEEVARRIRLLCDRRYGLGGDGVLAYSPSGAEGPAIRMRYWNRDGSVAAMCGNGARCVVRLAWERGEAGDPPRLHTDAGLHEVEVLASGPRLEVAVNLGRPEWRPDRIPVRAADPVVGAAWILDGRPVHVTAVSMGNPHAVVFVPTRAALDELDFERLGRELATHPDFPEGANASFVARVDDGLVVRVWERGVGPTLACGTAACAVVAADQRAREARAEVTRVHLPGGTVSVRSAPDGALWLVGPAVRVAEGTLDPEWLDAAAG